MAVVVVEDAALSVPRSRWWHCACGLYVRVGGEEGGGEELW